MAICCQVYDPCLLLNNILTLLRSGVMNMIECLFSQDVDLKPFIGRGAGGGITFSILSRTFKRVHIQF